MKLFTLDTRIIPSARLVGHVTYHRPWKHFTRTTDEYLLYVVKSGELYMREGLTEYALKKGDLLLLEPNVEHSGFKESICQYYYFHFKHPGIQPCKNVPDDEIPSALIEKRKQSLNSDCFYSYDESVPVLYIPKYHHCDNESELFAAVSEADQDFYEKYEGYKHLLSFRLLELLIQLSRDFTTSKINSTHPHFSKAFVKCTNILNYLNAEYMNKITGLDIEEVFESNYDYLNRVFQKMTGYSIMRYLTNLRISKAKQLLSTTDVKISEVGYLVGIDDPFYFTKLFKKQTGMTPSQYIKLQKATEL